MLPSRDYDTSQGLQKLLMQLQDVTLCADIMFLDGLIIMVTYSCRIGFTTVDFIEGQSPSILHKIIKRILALYNHRGIPVKYLITDRQFLPLEDALLVEDDVKLNVTR